MLSHLKVKKSVISPYVLLPGDPARVDIIGQQLEKFTIQGFNREFKTGTGTYRGIPITVCSTGIGCPSTAIAAEELIDAGAQFLIRVGTCGGAWRSDISAGSLIIPTASIRDEGTTIEYIPQGFPAVADRMIVNALVRSAEKMKIKYVAGINRTHDAFYGEMNSITKWGMYLNDARWRKNDTPIVSSEMESAALFVVAALCGAQAGAIFAVNADPESLKDRILGKRIPVVTESNEKITQQTVDAMIRIALDAMLVLVKQK